MKPASPEDPASVVRSQLTAWTAELEILSRDPSVRKFAELRQKIDEVDVFLDEAVAPPAPSRSSPFQPMAGTGDTNSGRHSAGRRSRLPSCPAWRQGGSRSGRSEAARCWFGHRLETAWPWWP